MVTPVAGRIVVVGLGPGDPGLVTAATLAAVDAIPVRYLRTARHPSAHLVGKARSFDDRYEAAARIEDVYDGIVATLREEAARHGEVLYAVPGSPLVAERTVELLRAGGSGREVRVLPALSFLDLAWERLGVDPVAAGVRLVDGHRFEVEAAGAAGPLLVGQTDRRLVLSEIKLSVDGDPGPVVVLQRLGLPDEAVTEVAWSDLDRAVEPDHLTCLWIPRLAEPVAGEVARLVALTRDLRSRCDWDRAQTHASLRRHLLGEAYEVLDAIDELPSDDGWELLEEELGDLLFQIAFHAQLAGEEGRFGFADVARGIHDKLVARHPHLFGLDEDGTADSSDRSWEERKRREKGRTSVLDGIPTSLPALAGAEKLQRRAAGIGLDWEGADAVWAVVEGELAELREADEAPEGPAREAAVEAEVGDVLFSVVNLARKLGADAELALRAAAARFASRVTAVEGLAAEQGLDQAALAALDPDAADRLWQEAKRRAGTGA
ncbi:nucleoside triphosphate pyrophosphohydrolase [Acidimicrobiaceae bacterium USS-CC1]|uniref:Nucleoside triphosphate pyrophosphohydrolase n=1 Tax=Acidiferrimicrobium australe TaxID=2664430 RepID=A0ABW9QPR1_9ACTN|nr:nucleoside triphosphate pyrophosphohydrolase [Acidiferrimicrobium australe]